MGIQAQVAEELKHIPDDPKPTQGMLRSAFQNLRTHSLGKKAEKEWTRRDVLLEAVRIVREADPTLELHYDTEFFAEEPKGE